MKYKYSLGMYEKALPDEMSLEEKMTLARESGYDHMEICIDLNEGRAARLLWNKKERMYWRELADKMGVPFTTLSLSLLRQTPLGLLDEARNETAIRIFDEGCRLAVDLGSRVMLINGYDVYGEESSEATRERFYQNYEKCACIAASYGVMCGIENAEMPFCQTIEDAVKISQAAESPYMKVYGDIANQNVAFNYDTDRAVENLLKGKGNVVAMHLKDSTNGEYRYKEYGSGRVDFERCVAAAKQIGVRIFTAEIFCDKDADQKKRITDIAGFLRSYLD